MLRLRLLVHPRILYWRRLRVRVVLVHHLLLLLLLRCWWRRRVLMLGKLHPLH
jgi:hypothetical protein